MSKTVSLNFRSQMYAEYTDEVLIVLITITHPDIPGTLRLSSDPTVRLSDAPLTYGTVSNGQNFLFCPMAVTLPDDVAERAGAARLEIENVSQVLIDIVRSVTTPGKCDFDIILDSDPDTIEIAYPTLDISAMQYNASMLTVEFGNDALDNEAFPSGTFAPYGFPNLF